VARTGVYEHNSVRVCTAEVSGSNPLRSTTRLRSGAGLLCGGRPAEEPPKWPRANIRLTNGSSRRPSGWSDWERLWFPEITVVAPDDHSNDGKNLEQFRSGDVAGNLEVAKEVTVLIDTTPPEVVAVLRAEAVHGHRAVIDFKVTGMLSPKMQVEAVVFDSAGTEVHKASSGGCGSNASTI
jgi:hypothetical protein